MEDKQMKISWGNPNLNPTPTTATGFYYLDGNEWKPISEFKPDNGIYDITIQSVMTTDTFVTLDNIKWGGWSYEDGQTRHSGEWRKVFAQCTKASPTPINGVILTTEQRVTLGEASLKSGDPKVKVSWKTDTGAGVNAVLTLTWTGSKDSGEWSWECSGAKLAKENKCTGVIGEKNIESLTIKVVDKNHVFYPCIVHCYAPLACDENNKFGAVAASLSYDHMSRTHSHTFNKKIYAPAWQWFMVNVYQENSLPSFTPK